VSSTEAVKPVVDRPAPGHAPARLAPFQWKKGQSGNPHGKGGEYKTVMRIAKANSIVAINKLVDLMNSDDDRVAYTASMAIIERAHGKPKEQTPDEGPKIPDLTGLSQKDLAAVRKAMSILKAHAAVDVTPEVNAQVRESNETPSVEQPEA
jgi:hypothetical protein